MRLLRLSIFGIVFYLISSVAWAEEAVQVPGSGESILLQDAGSQEKKSAADFLSDLLTQYAGPDRFTPYVGSVGEPVILGTSKLQSSLFTHINEKFRFDYTGIAGISYHVSPELNISFEYNYFALENYDLKIAADNPFESKYESHNFFIGIQLNF